VDYRLNGVRQKQRIDGPGQPDVPVINTQRSIFEERVTDLFEKERIAACACMQNFCNVFRELISTGHRGKHRS
jgi:hypothetical protein